MLSNFSFNFTVPGARFPEDPALFEKNFPKAAVILQNECALFSGNSLFFENFDFEV
jgi:hypothetical protein